MESPTIQQLRGLANWIKASMKAAGIDTTTFTPGSCRGAACSKAKNIGVPLTTILASGNWKRSSTFFRFYCREIVSTIGDEEEGG